MSYHILSESDLSCERTIIYQTVHENFIVIVQQKRSHEKEEWITHDHCMLPKISKNIHQFYGSVTRQTRNYW